jgi:hypothetical protein
VRTPRARHPHQYWHAEDAVDVTAFLQAATAFVNDQCFGTLSMSISIHPSTQKQNGNEILGAIDKLRYGTIVVNQAGQHLPRLLLCVNPWFGKSMHICTSVTVSKARWQE